MFLRFHTISSLTVLLPIILNVFVNIHDVVGQRQLSGINRRDPRLYTHYEVLDPERKYVLEWTVNWEQKRILFNVTVQARGYVGFGLSAKGLMDGADIVIGGVDRFGQSYFTDRHGVENEEPRIDPSQDWQLHEARESRHHTFLSFSRAFDTCDENDYPINERDAIVLIWAYSDSDDTSQYHFGNRGEYTVYLLEPNVTPRSIKVESFIAGPPSRSLLAQENLRLWTISTRYTMSSQDTIYHCNMHKVPRLKSKHHIVGYQTRLESAEALKHVHHLLLYRCNPPQNTTAAAFFERFVNHPGQQCFFMGNPIGELPTQYCTTIKHGFGIGGRIMFYPDHYAMPIGETGPDEYYVMQVHYDNPDQLSNVEVEINLDLYYTNQLRPNDAGMITIGHHVPGSPSILLPPSSLEHYIHGHCSPDCTRTMFPPEGIFISVVVLHTHYSGRKVKVRHFRGDQELPWISDDDNYENLYQGYRYLNREVNVKPGDQITVACEYDNTWTNGSVVGGHSTKQEMCLIYAYYYNGLPDYGLCRSELISQEYMQYYLGVNNVTWDNSQLELVATSPWNLAGLSMSTISNSVDWNMERRAQLQEDHRNHPQTTICSVSPFSSSALGQTQASAGAGGPGQTNMATLPNVVREYAPPPRECSRPDRPDWNHNIHTHSHSIDIDPVTRFNEEEDYWRKTRRGFNRFRGSGFGWASSG